MELYIVHILGGSEEREWPVLLDLCKDISNHLWFSCQRAETYEEFVVKHYFVSSRNCQILDNWRMNLLFVLTALSHWYFH